MSESSRESSPSSEEEISLPSELAHLSSCIEERPEGFGRGDQVTQLAALQAAKYVFDLGEPLHSFLPLKALIFIKALESEAASRSRISKLLSSLSPSFAPQTRSQATASEKEKQTLELEDSFPEPPTLEDTPVSELCIQGMDEDQLWAQLELRAQHVCEVLDFALEAGEEDDEDEEEGDEVKTAKKKLLDRIGERMDPDDLDDLEMDDDGEYGGSDDDDDESSGEEESEEDEQDEEDGDEELGEDVAELRDPSDEEGESSSSDLDKPSSAPGVKRPSRWKPKTGAHAQLDDGFFSLAAFNAETEEAESKTVSKGRLSADDEDSDEDMEEEVDYFTAVDDGADGEQDGTQGMHFASIFFIVIYTSVQKSFTRIFSNLLLVCPLNPRRPKSQPLPSKRMERYDSMRRCESRRFAQKGKIYRFRPCSTMMTTRTTTQTMTKQWQKPTLRTVHSRGTATRK